MTRGPREQQHLAGPTCRCGFSTPLFRFCRCSVALARGERERRPHGLGGVRVRLLTGGPRVGGTRTSVWSVLVWNVSALVRMFTGGGGRCGVHVTARSLARRRTSRRLVAVACSCSRLRGRQPRLPCGARPSRSMRRRRRQQGELSRCDRLLILLSHACRFVRGLRASTGRARCLQDREHETRVRIVMVWFRVEYSWILGFAGSSLGMISHSWLLGSVSGLFFTR